MALAQRRMVSPNHEPIDSRRYLSSYGEQPYMGGAQPIDRVEFAKHLRGARALASLLSDGEVATKMQELGFEVTKWRVYAWMKGESLPRLDEWTGLLIVLQPPGGFSFFRRCFRPDIYDRFMKLFDDET